MTENNVNIRLELGIDARKFIQQVQIYNGLVEDQIAKGIELALNDLLLEDNFIQLVRQNTKTELVNIVNKAVISYDTRLRIEKIVAEKIGEKINEYADDIAEKVTSGLKKI